MKRNPILIILAVAAVYGFTYLYPSSIDDESMHDELTHYTELLDTAQCDNLRAAQAIAERYPDLKLSCGFTNKSFQEVEREILVPALQGSKPHFKLSSLWEWQLGYQEITLVNTLNGKTHLVAYGNLGGAQGVIIGEPKS